MKKTCFVAILMALMSGLAQAQTSQSVELSGSPKSIPCGTPRPTGVIKSSVPNELGQPLTIYTMAMPPVIAPKNGQLEVPVVMCSRTYTETLIQANIVVSGPGKVSEHNSVATTQIFPAPSLGQCSDFTITLPVDSGLPNGHYYCANIKIGSVGQEGYAETTACALKGVQP